MLIFNQREPLVCKKESSNHKKMEISKLANITLFKKSLSLIKMQTNAAQEVPETENYWTQKKKKGRRSNQISRKG